MENQFYHMRWPFLNVTIFITHMCNCIMGATPMHFLKMAEEKEASSLALIGFLLSCGCVLSSLTHGANELAFNG